MILNLFREILKSIFLLFILILFSISGIVYFGLSEAGSQENNPAPPEKKADVVEIELDAVFNIESNFEEIEKDINIDIDYFTQLKEQKRLLENNKERINKIIDSEINKIENRYHNKISRKEKQLDNELYEFVEKQNRYIDEKIRKKQKEYQKKIEERLLEQEDSHLKELGQLERKLLGDNYSKKINLQLKLNVIEFSDREQMMYEHELEQIEEEIVQKLAEKESELLKEFEEEVDQLEKKYQKKLDQYLEKLENEKENIVQKKEDELQKELNEYISEQKKAMNEVIKTQRKHFQKLYRESINFQQEIINKLN